MTGGIHFSFIPVGIENKSLMNQLFDARNGDDDWSETSIARDGEECYINENRRLPLQLCRDLVSVWGYGGKPFFLPETVGFPIGQDQNEYFLYESHFDNPDLRSDLEFETGVEYFFTPKTRQREGGVLILGFDVPGSLAAIPPGSPAFDVIGHCNPNCTATMSPTGIDVIAVGLHTHNYGRKLRLRHFRNNQELNWLQNDDNYNPAYQQLRLLSHEKKVLPGDQLITRCTYDNTANNGTTTLTGFGTPDEMCLSFVIIANRLPYYRCTSEYPAERLLSAFGVRDVIWDVERQQRLVTSPPSLEGLTLNQVADYHVSWTEELRQRLEKDMMYSPHVTTCPTSAVPSTQTFLTSLSPQIAQRAASATNQELQEIVRQGVSQLIQLGTRGLRQQAEQETEQPIGQERQQETEQGNPQQNAGWTSPTEYQQQQSPISVAGTPPVFPQGTPPTGVSGLGVPPNAVFPKSATTYQPPPTCKAPRPPSRQVIKLEDPKISGRSSLPNTIIGFNRGKLTFFTS